MEQGRLVVTEILRGDGILFSFVARGRGGKGGEIVSFLEGRFIRLNRGKDRGVNLEIWGCHALERIEN